MFYIKQKTAYEMRISDCSSDVCSSDLDLDLLLAVGLQVDRELGLLFGSGGTGGGRTGGNGHRGGGGHAELLFHRLDQLHHLDEGLAADRFDDLLVGKGHLDYLCYLKLETAIDLETREPSWVCRVIAASAAPACFRPPSAGRPRW